MNRKRLFATVLALALATAVPAYAAETTPLPQDPDVPQESELPLLIVPAPDAGEAAEDDEVVAPPPCGGYATVISINGKPLEAFSFSKSIPGWGSKTVTWQIDQLDAVPAGYVPMRAIVQADHGNVFWYEEENRCWFTLAGHHIDVSFDDLSIVVEDQPLEGVSALLINGVTYLPTSVIDGLEGCSVTDLSSDGVERYDISTPNGAPMMALAWELQEMGALAAGGETSAETFEQFYSDITDFKAEYVTQFIAFTPMNVSPDTLIIGKLAEGKLEEVRTAMEAYRQNKEGTFTWYLSWNLPKVQDARFVTEGNWFLFYIGENADTVVETFRAGVPGLE